jgi:hypothetical protein
MRPTNEARPTNDRRARRLRGAYSRTARMKPTYWVPEPLLSVAPFHRAWPRR